MCEFCHYHRVPELINLKRINGLDHGLVCFGLWSLGSCYDASAVVEQCGGDSRKSKLFTSEWPASRERRGKSRLLGSLYMCSVNELTSFYKVSSWNFSNSDFPFSNSDMG